MLRVGLTGGIGSGKSIVADLFAELGVTIIDADYIAHEITKTNEEVIHTINNHFDNTLLKPDGHLNRKKLRSLIFEHQIEKKWLEEYLHPIILNEMREQIELVMTRYCICVIPLLIESSQVDFIDRICVVDTTPELQVMRATQRDETSKEDIEAIIHSQVPRERRLAAADDIIENISDIDSLRQQVEKLHQLYIDLS